MSNDQRSFLFKRFHSFLVGIIRDIGKAFFFFGFKPASFIQTNNTENISAKLRLHMKPIIYNLCFWQMLCYKLVVRCVHAHRYHDDCRQGVGRHIFKELFKILHRSAFIFDYPTFSVMKEKIADAKYISNFEKQLFNLIENNLNY